MALTLGDNFSYQGAKPLDARLIYSTVASMKAVADSTMYDGCMAYCTATSKTYQWKSTNTVDEDTGKWREFTSGGDTIQVDTLPTAGADELGNVYQYVGSTTSTLTHGYFYECVSDGESTPTYSWSQVEVSKGGHDIKNNGVAVTSRDTMNFTDFDIADDSTNEETDIKAHRLTQAEMTEIMSTLPGVPSVDAILFDERGTEYQIGWYVLANGTKKPVYERNIVVNNFNIVSGDNTIYEMPIGTQDFHIDNLIYTNIEHRRYRNVDGNDRYYYKYNNRTHSTSASYSYGMNSINTDENTSIKILMYFGANAATESADGTNSFYITIRYTKTTDVAS